MPQNKTKQNKNLGINLTMELKDMYTENCKTLMKEIEGDTNKWKEPHVLGSEKVILLKYLYYLKTFTGSI